MDPITDNAYSELDNIFIPFPYNIERSDNSIKESARNKYPYAEDSSLSKYDGLYVLGERTGYFDGFKDGMKENRSLYNETISRYTELVDKILLYMKKEDALMNLVRAYHQTTNIDSSTVGSEITAKRLELSACVSEIINIITKDF